MHARFTQHLSWEKNSSVRRSDWQAGDGEVGSATWLRNRDQISLRLPHSPGRQRLAKSSDQRCRRCVGGNLAATS